MSPTDSDVRSPAQKSPFWQFSIKFYAVAGVAPACIRLQDEAGVDVNILFFLLWSASEGRALNATDIREIDSTVKNWRDTTIIPLRTMRRALKSPPEMLPAETAETFRNRIKAAELEAERLQQEALFALARKDRTGERELAPVEAARSSVAAYGTLLGAFPSEPIETILAAFAKTAANG